MPVSQRGEIQEPDAGNSSADLLGRLLSDPGTVGLRAMVAFVTYDGLIKLGTYKGGALHNFVDRGCSASIVVGIDTVTTGDALSEMARLSRDTENRFAARAFRSSRGIFHPKVYIFDRHDGTSTVVIGSNNATQGGLARNTEACAVLDGLEGEEMASWNHMWEQISGHRNVADITDELINDLRRSKERMRPLRRGVPIEAAEELAGAPYERTVLVRYVPLAGNRTSQMHLTREIVEQFFEMRVESGESITLHQVQLGEMLGSPEERQLVYSPRNKNCKVEIGGLGGIEYDKEHRPVLVMEKMDRHMYKYTVLLLGDSGYDNLTEMLDSLPRSKSLSSWITDIDTLLDTWPEYPR